MMVHKKDMQENDLFGSQEHKLRPNLHCLEVEQGNQAEDTVKYRCLKRPELHCTLVSFCSWENSLCLLGKSTQIVSVQKGK